MFAGKRPTNIGIQGGKLTPCPSSPNCVCSQISEVDKQHYIQPLSYSSSAAEALAKLKTVIESLPRTTIISETDTYLYAEFKSRLMGYVDDVEFLVDDAAKVIHVRSASRLGKSDLGVNRNRIEEIRGLFKG